MKKIFLCIFALLSYVNYGATLVIENNCIQGDLRILFMRINLGNTFYTYITPSNLPDYFMINSLDVFELTDNSAINRQFPFLNAPPFASNVINEANDSSVVLPLPTTTNNSIPSTTRFQLVSVGYHLQGAYANRFNMPETYNDTDGSFYYSENYNHDFIYSTVPGNPTYNVHYIRLGSIHSLTFSDN